MAEMKEVEIDISDETFLTLAKLAHEKDITLNEMISQILAEKLNKSDRNSV